MCDFATAEPSSSSDDVPEDDEDAAEEEDGAEGEARAGAGSWGGSGLLGRWRMAGEGRGEVRDCGALRVVTVVFADGGRDIGGAFISNVSIIFPPVQ